ncbi:MAG TPA: T9SS type A sorting domain-containing protein [Bacteroidales bacterium]|nr:T9SS type A sorting domain-containing protein [Bacteroidales bacterium]
MSDITITNGTASNLTGSGASYSVTVTATGAGAVSIDVAASAAQDAAGNYSLAASTLSLPYIPAPTIASVTSGSRCGAGIVTLEATASAGTINWYANATGGVSLGTGASFSTPALNNTTSFYVDATNLGATTPTRTEVVATIKAIPSVAATTPASRCGNGVVSLEATANAGTINWYSAAEGGDILGSGNSFVSPAISASTTYYVEVSENGCISASRTAIVATVNNVPEQPSEISGNASVTKGTKEAYNVISASGVTYEWTATAGTIVPSSNSAEITWNTNGAQTVTVTPSNNCGAGAARTLNVTVTSSTGINDEPVVAAYKIYPNPARDFIKIERAKDEECTVMIYSLNNKLVLEKTIYGKLERIEINSLGVGVYTIVITNKKGERISQKLIRL